MTTTTKQQSEGVNFQNHTSSKSSHGDCITPAVTAAVTASIMKNPPRVPTELQTVFLASNRGELVHTPPAVAFKVFAPRQLKTKKLSAVAFQEQKVTSRNNSRWMLAPVEKASACMPKVPSRAVSSQEPASPTPSHPDLCSTVNCTDRPKTVPRRKASQDNILPDSLRRCERQTNSVSTAKTYNSAMSQSDNSCRDFEPARKETIVSEPQQQLQSSPISCTRPKMPTRRPSFGEHASTKSLEKEVTPAHRQPPRDSGTTKFVSPCCSMGSADSSMSLANLLRSSPATVKFNSYFQKEQQHQRLREIYDEDLLAADISSDSEDDEASRLSPVVLPEPATELNRRRMSSSTVSSLSMSNWSVESLDEDGDSFVVHDN